MSSLRVLSFGAGVQSTALLLMSERGIIEPFDYAVFSDTGWEPSAVYEHLEKIKTKCKTPILVVENGNIRQDILLAAEGKRTFTSLPLYLKDELGNSQGILQRQCTYNYKIVPFRRAVRSLIKKHGLKLTKGVVDVALGISTDEIVRMKTSPVGYINNIFPLIERGLSRQDCIEFMSSVNETAPRSSCVGCPFHSKKEWDSLTKEEMSDAIFIDNKIRKIGKLKNFGFLHSSRKPLSDVFYSDNNEDIDFFGNECEGMCGI